MKDYYALFIYAVGTFCCVWSLFVPGIDYTTLGLVFIILGNQESEKKKWQKKIMSKENWTCPKCNGELKKKKDTGEGAKHCVDCGCGWFIVCTSKPRKGKKK